jgi:hypothetical protein
MNSFETKRPHTKTEESGIQVLKAGVLYFALVFAAGFVLGPVRILWVVPRFGTRMAELMEIPIYASGHHCLGALDSTASRCSIDNFQPTWYGLRRPRPVAGRGIYACAFVAGMSVSEYFASRDPVSGTVYYATLVVFAAMPLFAGRARKLPRRTDNLAKHESMRSVSNRASF